MPHIHKFGLISTSRSCLFQKLSISLIDPRFCLLGDPRKKPKENSSQSINSWLLWHFESSFKAFWGVLEENNCKNALYRILEIRRQSSSERAAVAIQCTTTNRTWQEWQNGSSLRCRAKRGITIISVYMCVCWLISLIFPLNIIHFLRLWKKAKKGLLIRFASLYFIVGGGEADFFRDLYLVVPLVCFVV